MNRGLLIFLGAVLLWWMVALLRAPSLDQSRRDENVRPLPPMQKTEMRAPASEEKSAPSEVVLEKPQVVEAPKPFEYQRELDSYARLHEKVLLTEQEKAEKKDLLSRPNFLQALAKRLTEPSLHPALVASQNLAVDLLLEAAKGGGDTLAAAQALTQVVQDTQVESASLALPVRQQLAGIKAEVLYHWTAQDPLRKDQVDRILPGPVSQKIWHNVRDRHASNQAESN